jgi:hypothetical protein
MNGFAEALQSGSIETTPSLRPAELDDFMAEQFEKETSEQSVQSHAKGGAASAEAAKTAPINDH